MIFDILTRRPPLMVAPHMACQSCLASTNYGGAMWYPEDYQCDPYGHLTNQAGHGAVGIGLALIALLALPPVWAWVAVVLVYLIGWEVVVQSSIKDGDLAPSWDWRDSLDDTSNVGGGAAVIVGALGWGYWAAVAGFAIWGAALAISTWRRM